MRPRIGIYVCHCGTNIAGKVDISSLVAFAHGLPGVQVARDYKFMCSDPGQELIQEDIRTRGLNRVVVASCSPRLHETTFQGACQRAGLNPYCFQMACIREHCSWVVEDGSEATAKAKALVAAAVARVVHHQRLSARTARVHPGVLVVGAGIAGIQAALDVARGGQRVYLVEREPSIGGHMVQFDKTFPTLDCAACISTPKTVAVAQDPNIELLTYSEVVEVEGAVGNFKVKIRRKPRYIREDLCTGCGECSAVCPVRLPSSFEQGLSTRAAIYRHFPQAVPVTYCIDKKDRAPCRVACPAGTNVQGYVQLIRQGKYQRALELIRERLPLPGVLGRVCPRPCEDRCRRQQVDSPVAIRELKRFVADQVDPAGLPLPAIEELPQRVAVVGSGPAGLTVAYDLRRRGYQVTIFEAMPVLGGMLRLGIPAYRLPRPVLEQEIAAILRLGIAVETGRRLGRDFSLDDLFGRGYDAVFLGIGAHRGIRLHLPGEDDCGGVEDAVAFLRRVNLGEQPPPGKNLVVIGGGNVAIDAARAALRLGCPRVRVVYRRTREEMPAYAEEIEAAVAEGVEILYQVMPVRVLGVAGRVSALECLRTEPGPADASGRRRPVPIGGSEFVLSCDAILAAVGQEPDTDWLAEVPDLEVSRRNTLVVDALTMQTSKHGVFAGGDAVSGPATVIEAVAAGHRAAAAIHRYLQDGDLAGFKKELAARPGPGTEWQPIPAGVKTEPRLVVPKLGPEKRHRSFAEVALGVDEDAALREASRCVNCGGCCECLECVAVCERQAIDHGMQSQEVEVTVGSIIAATGFDIFDPTAMPQYGYGRLPEVYTGLEFERLNNATGPTGGRIVCKDGKVPGSVGIIHCVGSRDVNYHEYCSRVCCMYALKYGHLIKEKLGEAAPVYNFYIDMRCFGKGYEEFYRRLQGEGVTFIRGRPAEVTDEAQSLEEQGKLVVVCEDTLSGITLRVPVDMVILCTAMEPARGAAAVARTLGLSLGSDGFFLEQHPKLGPVATATDGVFLAGACQGPKDIPDAVAHAAGAAAQALALASRGTVEIPALTASIDPELCAGCQTCLHLCPFGAIGFDGRRQVSVVNDSLCKGCGSCSAVCPSGAARTNHFTARQVVAEIEGLLEEISA